MNVAPLMDGLCRALHRQPLGRAQAIGRAVGWVLGSIFRYHRGDALDALRRSLPGVDEPERRRIIRRMYAHIGINAVEFLRLEPGDGAYIRTHVRLEGEEHVKAALAGGRGAIILTGHVGNWALLCAAAPLWGYPVTIIAKRLHSRSANDYWVDRCARFGVRLVPGLHSYRTCLEALGRNELVAFILDQNMRSGRRGIYVDFFGRPASTSPGLAMMSAQAGAPVLPVFAAREPDGVSHTVRVLPALAPPPDRSPAEVQAHTQRYTALIESAVRERPDQWIWIHRRWRTQPRPARRA